MLEETLVTAQKRVQSMQDVPATISAIGEQELRDAGLFDIHSVGQREPGIYFEGQAKSRPVVVIRGIGQSAASIHSETAVGIFVDGVYMPRISGAIQSLANVDRIEVLKGPQGTLYGRNTIGGAMSIYTRKPSEDFNGHVDAGFGNYESWHLGAYVEGALVADRVAGSLGLSQNRKGGVREDAPTGVENDEESTYARGRLLFTPSDSLELDFTVTYSNEEVDAVLEEPDGAFPIPFTAAPAPVPPFPPGTILFSVPPEEQMAALADSAADFYSDSMSEPGLVDVETFLANATVTWSSEQFELTSITGYYETEARTVRDFDVSRFEIIDTDDNSESDTFSQELRLSSCKTKATTARSNTSSRLSLAFGLQAASLLTRSRRYTTQSAR
jgi:iron complex outermembrane receptor protein